MLWVAIVAAAAQVLGLWACLALRGQSGLRGFLVLPAMLLVLWSIGPMIAIIWLQGIILVPTALYFALRRYPPHTFLIMGTGLAAFLLLNAGLRGMRDWSQAQREYPYVSIADRLAYEERARGADLTEAQPTAAASAGMAADESFYDRLSGYRAQALRIVHASQVEQFISSPGFGIARGIGPAVPSLDLGDVPPVPVVGDVSTGETTPEVRTGMPPKPYFCSYLHRDALHDFVNYKGFGYVRDRDHVAGFQSHRFSRMPTIFTRETIQTTRVELVSLLKHERPVVYVSANLPRMDELKIAPVRPLDGFELSALDQLRQGEETVGAASGNQIRMLGAVRAVKQCLECHSVKHGTLLGAFSYELVRLTPQPASPAAESAQPAF